MVNSGANERLTNLLAVTDAALGDLTVDDYLVEILDRVRTAVNADTAAVLLREPGSDELVARAAWGLEDEVRQGVRIPIGTGFAGRIAATRAPVVLDRVGPETVTNPILWESGVKVMLGVPLLASDRLLGVLHVGRLVEDEFTDDDVVLMQIVADRVAGAFQRRQLAAEATAARLLERGLQPSRLPRLSGLQFASRYVPAERRGIGGDWYDCFTLPDGRLWLVTGDVAGHGLSAAVVMGRVKSALRSYALLGDGPARTLERTDRKLQHFEIGTMVTVICAVAEPPYDAFAISSAGHLPPVLAEPGQPGRLVDVATTPPLGLIPDVAREEQRVEFLPGAVLLLFTDGLVERRDEDITEGLERLRKTADADRPEAVCQRVMHELIGRKPTTDDVALLAVRRLPEPAT
ncbi:MAG: SpoIIE family protein phosphatase [Actinobacteria bacterium]|nr:SpoIIE family protein phosphatase [Actinomycetota bacterium]